MSNNLYHPDKWVVIGINTGEEIIYKVLGGWYGDTWMGIVGGCPVGLFLLRQMTHIIL